MRKLLIFSFFLCLTFANAQKVRFEYDVAGNQVQRKWCPTCLSKNVNQEFKEISKLEDSDLQKFFPDDVISYYPNPVKEELYLKWDLINDNRVSTINVYGMNGQLLKTLDDNLENNSSVISFNDYPVGIYFVYLNYSNGDQKSIKIIKN